MTLISDSRMKNSYRNINIMFHATSTAQYREIIIATSLKNAAGGVKGPNQAAEKFPNPGPCLRGLRLVASTARKFFYPRAGVTVPHPVIPPRLGSNPGRWPPRRTGVPTTALQTRPEHRYLSLPTPNFFCTWDMLILALLIQRVEYGGN